MGGRIDSMAPVAGLQAGIPSFNEECCAGESAQPVLWKWCLMHRILLETEALGNMNTGTLTGCPVVPDEEQ